MSGSEGDRNGERGKKTETDRDRLGEAIGRQTE